MTTDASPATTALDALLSTPDLEPLELNLFRGQQPDEKRQRVFGGQVAAQAMVAAGRTIEGRSLHSLHAYFLRPGDPTIPIIYQVERTRDGRSFATRRVTATYISILRSGWSARARSSGSAIRSRMRASIMQCGSTDRCGRMNGCSHIGQS